MKVLVHAVGCHMGGAQRHLSGFLLHLNQDQSFRYVFLVDAVNKNLPHPSNVELVPIASNHARTGWRRIVFDWIKAPQLAKKYKADVIVSLSNFGPLWTPVPHIIFQRNALYFSRIYLSRVQGWTYFQTILRRFLAFLHVRFANKVVVPSQSMKKSILEVFKSAQEDKMCVLHHPVDLQMMSEELSEELKRKTSFSGLKIYYPALEGVHKGFDVFIEILSQAKAQLPQFKVYTNLTEDPDSKFYKSVHSKIVSNKLEENFVHLGSVHQSKMGALYKKMDFVIYSSLVESFGFGLVEALGFGKAILASDIEINRELGGEAIQYYSALDSRDGAKKILAILNMKEESSKKSSQRFLELKLNWDTYIEKFQKILSSTQIN